MTEYALAAGDCQHTTERVEGLLPTFVFWSLDQFPNHGLDDTNVPIECSTNHSTEQCYPEIGREANNEKGEHCTSAADQEHRLSTDSV